ncbi:MAG TPA: hypothetical protein VF310_03180, partial [Vicinamibacteria bacterium]
AEAALPPAAPVRTPQAVPPEPTPPPPLAVARPDNAELNRLWDVGGEDPPGLLRRLVHRLTRGFRHSPWTLRRAQRAFNARQVQFDNELLAYVEARLHETHRHYDTVLGGTARHLAEADERHLILQEELVAHVHDLVKRIDLVLAESEKGRLSLESALRDVRARLKQLEERLERA